MHVAQVHAHAQDRVAEVLLFIVDAVIAVELVDHVVHLGEDEAAEVLVQAVLVEHVVVLPAEVAVARAVLHAPDHAALGVHQRHAALAVAADAVPVAARVGGAAGRVDLLLDGHVAVDVEVPGVQVRLHVVVVAGGVVLHDARRVKGLDAAVDPAHPLPAEHGAQLRFELRARRLRGIAVEADHVRKGEHAQAVHPVELARLLGLDVQAHEVEADVLGPLHGGDDRLLAGQGEEALGVKALVEHAV